MQMSKALALVAAVLLILPVVSPSAFAEGSFAERREARQAQSQFAGNLAAFRQAAGRHLDLDLASTVQSVAVTQAMLGNVAQASINVGGVGRQVAVGDMLTPSEFVALAQVMGGKSQSLMVSGSGEAIGGSFSVSDLNTSRLSNLVVPTAVTAVISGAFGLHVSDTLSAQGTVMGLGNNPQNLVNIRAGNVLVNGSVMTAESTEHPINMTLFSASDIANSGTISASGFLSLYAGGEITNVSVNGQAPATISGGQGVLLYSNAGALTNSGTVAAHAGNLYVNAQANQSLVVNNVGGTVSANQGSIVLRDVGFTAKNLTAVHGGNLAANTLEILGGNGTANILVNRIDGTVNITGCDAHVEVAEGTLALGTMDLSGDPTYVNSGGGILLGQNVVHPGQDVAMLAKTSIVASQTVNLIDVSSKTGRGGDLYIMAGYTISPSTPANGVINTSTNYSVSDASSEGGSVGLQQVQVKTGSGSTFRGGNVKIYAHAGSESATGIVRIGGITTSSAKQSGGNVQILSDGAEIWVCGPINTQGPVSGGSVEISGATPDIDTTMHFLNGTLLGGSITTTPSPATSVTVGDNVKADGNIITSSAMSAGSVTINGSYAVVNGQINAGSALSGGAVEINSGSTILVKGAIAASGTNANGNDVTLVAQQNIDVLGNITTSGKLQGGNVSIATEAGGHVNVGFNYIGQSPLALTTNGGIFTNSSAGEGGSVEIDSNASVRIGKGINASGVVSGGAITIDAEALVFISGPITSMGGTYTVGGSKEYGTGGDVHIVATQQPLETRSINTSGPGGGGLVDLAAVEIVIRGAIISDAKNTLDDGVFAGNIVVAAHGEVFIGGAVSAQGANGGIIALGTAASVLTVNGSINATGTLGVAGETTLLGESGVTVTSDITLKGQTSGGALFIDGGNSLVNIGGSINTSGLNQSGLLGPGDAGSIGIGACGISIKGNLIAQGGAGSEGQDGGAGNSIGLLTASFTQASVTKHIGFIDIGGTVSTKGGAGGSGADGGEAGDALLLAGTVQIRGSSGGSVVTLGGKAGTGGAAGANGTIDIKTFDVQPVPTFFDLGSTVSSEYALPGAMFEVGNAGVNGSAGALIAGDATNTLSATRVFGERQQGGVTVNAVGQTSVQIDQDGTLRTINLLSNPLDNNSARAKITPAQALAVFQVVRGAPQTFGLTSAGAASDKQLPGLTAPNTIIISAQEFARPFTAFNIRTGVVGSEGAIAVGVLLSDTGETARIIMSPSLKTATITGQLGFVDGFDTGPTIVSSGRLDLGAASLTIALGGILSSVSTTRLDIVGSSALNVKNNGTIVSVASILMSTGDKSTVNLTFGDSAQIGANNGGSAGGMLIRAGRGSANLGTVNIQNANNTLPGAFIDLTVSLFGNQVVVGSSKVELNVLRVFGPQMAGVSSLTVGSLTTANVNISSHLSLSSQVASGQDMVINSAGDISFTGLVFDSRKNATVSAVGSVFFENVNKLIAQGNLVINSGTIVTPGVIESDGAVGNSLQAESGKLTLNGKSGISFDGLTVFRSGGTTLLNSSGDVFINAISISGGPTTDGNFVATNGLLPTSLIKSSGDIILTGDNVELSDGNVLTAYGGSVRLVATSGNVELGDSSEFRSFGGNISVMASQNVIGGAPGLSLYGNYFLCVATTSGGGGGIEILAGSTTSQIAAELKARPTPPSIVANGMTVDVGNSVKGTLKVTGTVTLLPNNATNFVLLQNGVVLIRNLGGLTQLQLNTPVFESYAKISHLSNDLPDTGEQIVDTGECEEIAMDFSDI